MRTNISRLLGGVICVLILAFAAPASAERIVAVGDLHGDYEAYVAILAEAGLIDGRGKWAGGEAILVQTGDIADRGPDTLKIIRHLMKLEKAARRKRGRVVALIGNHEAMNMTGDLRYVTPAEFDAFSSASSERLRRRYFEQNRADILARYPDAATEDDARAKFFAEFPAGYLEHRLAWAPTGFVGKWILKHNAIERIGRTLFVHGGVSGAYADASIEDINRRVRDALSGAGDAAILTDENSPLWYRGYADDEGAGVAQLLDRVLENFDVDRVVVGHTPALDGIAVRAGGGVLMIDTGVSAYYGGVRSWLEIEDGRLIAHENGAEREIRSEGEQP